MPTRQDIITAARSYLGTPFHHQGRLRGVGIDCVGLLVCAAQDVGLPMIDCSTYSRYPDGETLRLHIEKNVDPISTHDLVVGDIIVFRMRKYACHVALRTDVGMIHAFATVGRVVEHGYTEPWLSRTCGAYRFRGLED